MKHDLGNGRLAMPASVAHRAMDLFDHRHGWNESGDGHHHQHSAATASASQDSLTAVIGGSATAMGDATAVSGFVENFAADQGAYSIAVGDAIFQASARSFDPGGAIAAAGTFLDVSGADYIFAQEVAQSKHGSHDASALSELDYLAIDIHGWSPRHGPIVIELDGSFGHHQAVGDHPLQGAFAQVFAMAEAHGANTLADTLVNTLTVENHFSFVNAMSMVAL
jgi:hypothetical protein